jgi:hypothetical protein
MLEKPFSYPMIPPFTSSKWEKKSPFYLKLEFLSSLFNVKKFKGTLDIFRSSFNPNLRLNKN